MISPPANWKTKNLTAALLRPTGQPTDQEEGRISVASKTTATMATARRSGRLERNRAHRSLRVPNRLRRVAPSRSVPTTPVAVAAPTEAPAKARDEALRFFLEPSDPVVDAPSIGPKTAERLQAVGLKTVADLLAADCAAGGRRDQLPAHHTGSGSCMANSDATRLPHAESARARRADPGGLWDNVTGRTNGCQRIGPVQPSAAIRAQSRGKTHSAKLPRARCGRGQCLDPLGPQGPHRQVTSFSPSRCALRTTAGLRS